MRLTASYSMQQSIQLNHLSGNELGDSEVATSSEDLEIEEDDG